MSIIYLTGDTHGSHTINKLASSNFPEGLKLTKQDYVIILGDFGLIWKDEPDKNELYWMEWLTNKPWTTLVLQGNHENNPRINSLPTVKKFGSIIHKYNESIFFFKRGEIYNIDNDIFFTMGGAISIDKDEREPGRTWWPEEIPSTAEFELGLTNLDKIDWNVDYILGHTTDNDTIDIMFNPRWKLNDAVCNYFDIIVEKINFKIFYFGHWHKDQKHKKYHCLYHDIIKLGT